MVDFSDVWEAAIGFTVAFAALSVVSVVVARLLGTDPDADETAPARLDTATRRLLSNIGL